MLPLHLCNMMLLLACFMLIFKNYRIYEFVYFLGIGAACAGKKVGLSHGINGTFFGRSMDKPFYRF